MPAANNRWLASLAFLLRAMVCLSLASLSLVVHAQTGTTAAEGRRVALVIGNAGYDFAPLRNPVNDATDLSARLTALGFEVTTLTDRNRSQMTQAICSFGLQAQGADAALFYFAGHGMQVRGRNFLLPVGQRFATEAEVETDAVDVNAVLARLEEAGAKVSLLILDACRNNPLPRSSRSTSRGLARMDAPSGALVAFAAQPGAEAKDGTGRNGTYTKHLLKHIGTPGLPVEQVFKRVRADVERETGRVQSPREESSLTADFYFANPFAPVTPANRGAVEDAAWALCQNGATALPCNDYLAAWPQGRYTEPARTRLRDLAAAVNATAAAAVPPTPAGPAAGQVLKDCAECPEVVVIAPGRFMMGSPNSEAGRNDNEGPQRPVRIAQAFALGRTEVTRREFGAFVRATGYRTEAERSGGCAAWSEQKWAYDAARNWRDPGFTQADDHPVVCVSDNDALAYVRWLNEVSRVKGWRLPSEAEWEYAARAGTGTRYAWGDDAGQRQQCEYGNGTDRSARAGVPGAGGWTIADCDDGHAYTAPVMQYRSNAFGLHDMAGNAWEWVQDCYGPYTEAPSDGAAKEAAGCGWRVLRGGGWSGSPQRLRSAIRDRDTPGYRNINTGFRLARTVF